MTAANYWALMKDMHPPGSAKALAGGCTCPKGEHTKFEWRWKFVDTCPIEIHRIFATGLKEEGMDALITPKAIKV